MCNIDDYKLNIDNVSDVVRPKDENALFCVLSFCNKITQILKT